MDNSPVEQHKHYQLVSKAITYLASQHQTQPALTEVAKHLNISEYHLHRVFSEWAGITPKQYIHFLTKEHAKSQLHSQSVMNTALASGLSSSSRLHDIMLTWEGVTPGEYKKRGENLLILYGLHTTPFGQCLIANTHRGICKLAFYDNDTEMKILLEELEKDWPNAQIQSEPDTTQALINRIFDRKINLQQPIHLVLKGTPFQLKVWEALLTIPSGHLCSYQGLSQQLGKPSATRAVASAIAKNNIGYLIPCHRVIRSTGEFNQYRWNPIRKKAMVAWEAAQTP